MVSRAGLEEQFSNFGFELDDSVLEKCFEVCLEAGVGEEEFLETWMAYSVSRLGGADPTVELVAQMERDEYGKKTASQNRHITPSKANGRGIKDSGDLIIYDLSSRNTPSSKIDVDLLETYCITPKVSKGKQQKGGALTPLQEPKEKSALTPLRSMLNFSPASYSPTTAVSSTTYLGRNNAGQVVCSHNVSGEWVWSESQDGFCPRVELMAPSGDGSTLEQKRYMNDVIGDISELLDGHIRRMKKWLNERLGTWQPEPLDMPNQSSQKYLGRICCDGTGRLNKESILMEGAADSTVVGRPVRVDVSAVQSSEGIAESLGEPYSLFPGQVVVMDGQNQRGQRLLAQQIYVDATAPLSSKAPSISFETGALRVVVGAGPFTQMDTLSYEPLQDLVGYVREHNPHVVILVGPFVDCAHPLISGDGGCQLAETFEVYFDRMVDEMMGQMQGMTTQVVLVSSAKDVHGHPVFPTPPYAFLPRGQAVQYVIRGSESERSKRPRVIVAPDPCLLDVEGVVIGVTATDILFHLGREEFSGPGHKRDRLGRLARHLIQQRNFYPLYPPAIGVNLDMKLWSQLCTMPITPHILILPSDFRSFIKNVGECVVMNPERLTKGIGGGSFARFEVRPAAEWRPSLLNNVFAQIVKI